VTSQSESRKTQQSLITLRQLCRSTSLDWVTPDPALPWHSVTNRNQHSRGQPTAWSSSGVDRRCTDGGHAARWVAAQPGRRPPPSRAGRTTGPLCPAAPRWDHQFGARPDEPAGQVHRAGANCGAGQRSRRARKAVSRPREGPAAGPAGRTALAPTRDPTAGAFAVVPSGERPVDDRRRDQGRPEIVARSGTTAAELHRYQADKIPGGSSTLRTVMTGHAGSEMCGNALDPSAARPFGAVGRSPG
jgi:hypothetical protein